MIPTPIVISIAVLISFLLTMYLIVMITRPKWLAHCLGMIKMTISSQKDASLITSFETLGSALSMCLTTGTTTVGSGMHLKVQDKKTDDRFNGEFSIYVTDERDPSNSSIITFAGPAAQLAVLYKNILPFVH
jgi:hypothetical protein